MPTGHEVRDWHVIDTYDDIFDNYRQFGPFPTRDEAVAWATEHGKRFAHAIVRAFVPAALAILLASPAHAAPPTFELPLHPPDTYLAGCAITSYDDGSRLAECDEDGAVLVFDVDGNRWVNEKNAPIRAAGWYVLE